MFSSSIVEDEVIKGINEKIKKIKDEPELRSNDLEEKEAYCTGCLDDVEAAIVKFDPDLVRLEENRLRIESDPKCPSCEIVGMDYISSFSSKQSAQGGSPWFGIVACHKCGHVYGTIKT